MKKVLILLLLLVAFGCSKKQHVQPADTTVGTEDTVQETTIKDDTMASDMEKEVVEDIMIAKEEDISESSLPIEEQVKSIFQDVLFDYDKYDIRPEARPVLDSVATFMVNNSAVSIIIEGHCDDRGTNEYNLALGEKRANASKNYLVSLGVSPSRMIVLTYGEEKPVCIDQSERCWQLNRRAHFVLAQ